MTEMKPSLNHKPHRIPESEQMKDFLRSAMPRIAKDAEPSRDLWPDVLRRMEREPVSVPWFDWVLVAGLVALAAVFPTAIPVFLYYL
jgi:anti-sigma factor RsiW